jgi:hypothetical protein
MKRATTTTTRVTSRMYSCQEQDKCASLPQIVLLWKCSRRSRGGKGLIGAEVPCAAGKWHAGSATHLAGGQDLRRGCPHIPPPDSHHFRPWAHTESVSQSVSQSRGAACLLACSPSLWCVSDSLQYVRVGSPISQQQAHDAVPHFRLPTILA